MSQLRKQSLTVLKRQNNNGDEIVRLTFLYKFHLNKAVENDNFLAVYIYLKECFENNTEEKSVDECISSFKTAKKEYFPWLCTFGTVAELYKAQLYFSMINILLSKVSSLQANPPEYENCSVRNKRVEDLN